ncbi:unnamed protein product [Bemisia tabaci]|uniref:E2 ubiquitin-conjugating enzyme n=1 Tax=Bemisia tabaci TaxID=7038 RepID=A0A9P0F459_BEMTA|nr:unnamed protein product [Bemisia tabaci]
MSVNHQASAADDLNDSPVVENGGENALSSNIKGSVSHIATNCNHLHDLEEQNEHDQNNTEDKTEDSNDPEKFDEGDHVPEPGPSQYNEEFSYSHTSCYYCNGYYEPSFDEPVCGTCHLFLFSDEVSRPHTTLPINSEKTDDGDSGNDEPTDGYYERRSSNQSGYPVPEQPPNLVERLNQLSTPRPSDNLSSHLVECLPSEVLLAVFSFLDDMSLWSVGFVCKRWHNLLRSHVPLESWKTYVKRRFPLYKPICNIYDWFQVYSQFMQSCPCKTCLQLSLQPQMRDEENTWRSNRLRNELKTLTSEPPEGIEAMPLDSNYCHWQATITGPVGSPYEGGIFYLYVLVPYGYPMSPPIVRFLTKIFHPNISRHGDVGLDSITHNWSLALTLSKVLISVQSLLTDPFCQVCMESDIGKLYLNNREVFEDIARTWTWKYAMHDILPPL